MNAITGADKKTPRLLRIAVVAAALIVPLLFLIDRIASPIGDGYGNTWLGGLVYLGCVLASAICMLIGLIRGERPRWLALIAVVLWPLPAAFLLF
jgi:hypothetical protein